MLNDLPENANRASIDARRAILAALAAQTATAVVEQGIPTLTAFIKDALSLSAATAGLVVAAFAFGKIAGSYPAGRAVDALGERTVLVVGGLATSALVLLAAPLPLAGLVCLMIAAGSFAASTTPAGSKLVFGSSLAGRRGLAMGIRQTGVPLGGLLAAGLLPWIASSAGWRVSLAVAAALAGVGALVVLAITGTNLRADRAETRLTRVEGERPRPWSDRDVILLTVWGCLIVSGQYALISFLALDIHESGTLSLPETSLLVVVAQVGGILGRLAWGVLSDHDPQQRRQPYLLGMNLIAIVVALAFAFGPARQSFPALMVVSVFAGLTLIGWQGLWVTAVSERAGPGRAGATLGFALSFIGAASAASPPLYGLVADLTGGLRSIWLALALVLALAL
ncbi:MAG TPA: MFS transporter, partial [Gaiellaceae bacterium]|nr:MFS transporter [Gaiellaceae bacterium]